MELKEGMYVRTLDGISKVIELRDNGVMTRFKNDEGNIYFTNDMMCNPSFKISDVLVAGDIAIMIAYGLPIFKQISEVDLLDIKLGNYQVYKVLTKEQFESISYEVGR